LFSGGRKISIAADEAKLNTTAGAGKFSIRCYQVLQLLGGAAASMNPVTEGCTAIHNMAPVKASGLRTGGQKPATASEH